MITAALDSGELGTRSTPARKAALTTTSWAPKVLCGRACYPCRMESQSVEGMARDDEKLPSLATLVKMSETRCSERSERSEYPWTLK